MTYTKYFNIFLIISFLIFGCQQKNETNVNDVDTSKLPDQEGWNSTLIATKSGQVSAIIKYGYMKRFNKKKIVYFEDGVHVDFYNAVGEHTSKLTSNKGKLDENTNNVEAHENVEVVSDSGITLKTEKLWWDNTLEKVVSDQFVTITTTEKDTLYGIGFESDQTLSNWIIKEVKGKTDKKFNLELDKQKSTTPDTTTQAVAVNDSSRSEKTDSLKLEQPKTELKDN